MSPRTTPVTRSWVPAGLAKYGATAGALLLLACVLAACGGSVPTTLAFSVKSSVGSVLTGGSCEPSASGASVVAAGRTDGSTAEPLTLSLAVYNAEGAPLDLEGSAHSTSLAARATRWEVKAQINKGFAPTRCVVTVGIAETLKSFYIPSTAMSPKIKLGDRAIVNLSAYATASPSRGDIVAFQPPPSEECGATPAAAFVMRIIGLPTERIQGKNGAVYVNGLRLSEPWLQADPGDDTPDFGPLTIPKGDYFVMGDNRTDSCDSRTWGPLPESSILGELVKVVPGSPPSSTTTRPTSSSTKTTPYTFTTGS